MDLKLRLQKAHENERLSMKQPSKQNQNQTNLEFGLDKYARKTLPNVAPSKPNRNQQVNQKPPQQPAAPKAPAPLQKSSINRYYRNEAAPKSQFKHYLSDINNVFYEERQSIRLISLYNNMTKVTFTISLFLFIIFLGMFFIKPYQGICPSNAQCGVYVHCFKGFNYDAETNQCVLSQDLYDQIESVCTERIIKARQDWGSQQCNDEPDTIPKIHLDQILSGVSNFDLKRQLVRRLEEFLENNENREKLHFDYFRGSKVIMPSLKKYSLFCNIKYMTKSSNFKFGLPIFLLIALVIIYGFIEIRRRIIAKKIYQVLRNKTIAEKLLNISYAQPDVEQQYGIIDEKMWELIDQYRSNDKDIGYLQDDFLYWKML